MKASYSILSLIAVAILLTLIPNSFGQTDLPKEDQATMMFDIDVKGLRESEPIQAYGFDSLVEDLSLQHLEVHPKYVDRLVAYFRWPDDPREILAAGPGAEFPASFLWRIELNEPAPNVIDFVKQDSDAREIDGITYYQPAGISNVLFCATDEYVMVCSENYVNVDFDRITTEGLKKALSNIPTNQLAVGAADLETSRQFMNELYEIENNDLWMLMLSKELLALLKPYEHIDHVAMSFGLEGEQIFTGSATSATEEAAQEFASEFTQLLSMARIGGIMLMGEAGIRDEPTRKQIKSFLKQLKPERDRLTTRLAVKKPEGFNSLLIEVLAKFKGRQAEKKKLSRFRAVGIAVHNFLSEHDHFPFHNLEDDEYHDNLSWRIKTSAYHWRVDVLDFAAHEPWDSEQNKPFAEKMPPLFGDGDKNSDICWIKSKVTKFQDIPDGSSSTIMLLEYPTGVPWSQPKDISVLEAILMVKKLEDGQDLIAVMYDGSTRRIDTQLPNRS